MKVNSSTNSKIGIKGINDDIHPDMVDVVKNSFEYIVMGSYSINVYYFGKYKFDFFAEVCKKAKKIDCVAIIPNVFNNHFKSLINDQKKIEGLINKNIGVVINNYNHSKFFLSENDLYLGSANLTPDGFEYNIESVCLFRDLSKINKLRLDLIDFSISDLDRYISGHELSIDDEKFERENNDILASVSSLQDLALKLNPNIGKVLKTLSNYDKSNKILNNAVNKYFCILSIKDFSIVANKFFKLIKEYSQLIEYGNYLIDLYLKEDSEEQDLNVAMSEVKINKYNRLHNKYISTLEKLLFFIEGIPMNIKVKKSTDEFSLKNYEIIKSLKFKLEEQRRQIQVDQNGPFNGEHE